MSKTADSGIDEQQRQENEDRVGMALRILREEGMILDRQTPVPEWDPETFVPTASKSISTEAIMRIIAKLPDPETVSHNIIVPYIHGSGADIFKDNRVYGNPIYPLVSKLEFFIATKPCGVGREWRLKL